MVRRDSGLYGYERSLRRGGFDLVAGTDEAGRGACAGPLVAAAVILRPSTRIEGLADSKLLTPRRRERVYAEVVARALAWTVVSLDPGECDTLGMHVANLAALRRAVMRLAVPPDFVLSDGFAVDGLGLPNLGVWKGDQVAACVAAASVVAKVTRDQMMVRAHDSYPEYAFDIHKGYCTGLHQERLDRHGPSPIHRWCFDNVRRAAGTRAAASSSPSAID
ncbi:MAG: ribonuclease HII [Propionicimonas sp.]